MEVSPFSSKTDLFDYNFPTPSLELILPTPYHSHTNKKHPKNDTTQNQNNLPLLNDSYSNINNNNNNNNNSNNAIPNISSLFMSSDDNIDTATQQPSIIWDPELNGLFQFENSQPTRPPPEPQPKPSSKPGTRKKRSRPSIGSGATEPDSQSRRFWVQARSKDWWEKCTQPDFPEQEFKKSFHMSKSTLNFICEQLEPIITKKDTFLRAAVPVHQRVAVCIYRLATGEPLRLVSDRFGLGISTCHKLVLEVCNAIKVNLMSKFLKWPSNAKLSEIKSKFEEISGIPNIVGSIYTTHVPIIAPKNNVAVYFNKRETDRTQKCSYSVTIQGVVDPNGLFTDVCIGWPGSITDSEILEKSALVKRVNLGLLRDAWIVGNLNYPLLDWVLVPYPNKDSLTWTQHKLNEKIFEVQKFAKESFLRMKKRWVFLQKRNEVKLNELPVFLGACCVLHNICEMRNDAVDDELDNELEGFDYEVLPENAVRSVMAVQARDELAHKLLHSGIGGTSFL